jgi:hypothetical protein
LYSDHVYRFTSPSKSELTARSARSTPLTRSHSTRRVELLLADRVKDVMPPSKWVSVARPSPSSERRPRPPRRSLSSLNAPSARPVDSLPSSVASHSFLERRILPRVAPSSERVPLSPPPRRDDHTYLEHLTISHYDECAQA